MDNKLKEEIKMHVAGATIRHSSPFDELKSYSNSFELSQDFLDRWVKPYYAKISSTEGDWIKELMLLKEDITDDVIFKTLGDFNWRTRQTGAYFAAITNSKEFIDIIGVHLLKSEVCYAGKIYCLVLAYFNTERSVEYINRYLDYYLTRKDLSYDQVDAMEAILYLDKINHTNNFENQKERWSDFVKNNTTIKDELQTEAIEKGVDVLKRIQTV